MGFGEMGVDRKLFGRDRKRRKNNDLVKSVFGAHFNTFSDQ